MQKKKERKKIFKYTQCVTHPPTLTLINHLKFSNVMHFFAHLLNKRAEHEGHKNAMRNCAARAGKRERAREG